MKRPFHDVQPLIANVPTGERRLALVIGNGRYELEKDVLTNPPKDARGVAEALTRIGFFGVTADGDDFAVDFSTPGVVALLDLDQKRLGRALAALERVAGGARQAVIYYAGHGIEVAGENYLIPIDAKLAHIADAKYEAQPLSRALGAIDGSAGLRLVILDACRVNPFRARLFGHRDTSGGLRGVEPRGNVLVAYAAKHGTFASDGKDKSANSPFAAALLTHIEKPGLEVVELFREVKDDVIDATEGAQEPYLYGSLGRRREYFVPPTEILTPAPTAPIDEHTYWRDVKSSTDAVEIEAFLASFPDGVFAAVADERCKAAIDATGSPNALRSLLQRYPSGPRRVRMKQRLATVEWEQLRKSGDAEALNGFAREFAGLPEADLAQQRAASLGADGSTQKWRPIVTLGIAVAVLGIGFAGAYHFGARVAPPPAPSANNRNVPLVDLLQFDLMPENLIQEIRAELMLSLTSGERIKCITSASEIEKHRRLLTYQCDIGQRTVTIDAKIEGNPFRGDDFYLNGNSKKLVEPLSWKWQLTLGVRK